MKASDISKLKLLTVLLVIFILIYFVEGALFTLSNFLYPEKFSAQSKKITPGWDKAIRKKLKQIAQKKKEAQPQKQTKKAKRDKKINPDIFIRSWLICGPFPNPGGRKQGEVVEDLRKVGCKGFDEDFLVSQGGEINIEPREGIRQIYSGRVGGKKVYRYRWQEKKSPQAMIDFYKELEPYEYIVVYAACYIISDRDKDALIKLGSDDGHKLWVNHKLIGWDHIHRGSLPDQNTYQVKLKEGKNIIFIKIDQDFGGVNFYLRLTDLKGKPLSGIKAVIEP